MRRIIAALSGILVGLTLIAGPQPATARSLGTITINWSGSDEGDLGKIRVSTTSDQPIATLKAHVISATGGELATIDDFALTSGTSTNGIWTTRTRVQLTDLGTYRIDVEATDTEGTHVTAERTGQLIYMVKTVFDPLTPSRATVDYTHRHVTVKGRLYGIWPGSGERKPLGQGFPISFGISYLNKTGGYAGFDHAELTTDAKGRFRHSLTLKMGAEFRATYPYSNDHLWYMSGTSDKLIVKAKESATEVTANVAPARVNAGDPLTVSGLARWRSPAGWQPIPDTKLSVRVENTNGAPTSVTTDAQGRYSLTFVPYTTGTVTVAYYTEDPFKAHASTTIAFTVAHPASFTNLTAVREEAEVVVSGHLAFTGSSTPADPEAIIEFSTDGTTWATRSTRPAYWDGTGYAFADAITEPAAGHWRARFEGGEHFQDALSQSVQVGAAQ
ncbi:hypothetical protein ACGFNP_15720 [Nonomuraea sp. NPDC049269]|uniref:hypothetical protein n=1 Tax=Nonomuraea sp. NPDC049269 TaxID=3364349 RepID=UPI003713269A